MNLSTKLEIVNQSDVGQKRSHNEDSIIADISNGLVILADGMGGYKAGEVASALAVKEIFNRISKGLKKLKPGKIDKKTKFSRESILVKESIIQANLMIYNIAKFDKQYHGMGTTVIVGLFYNNTITIAHVGDSRLYRFKNKKLEQITKDHSLVQELVDRGIYTLEEAKINTPNNLITRAIGVDANVDIDMTEEIVFPGDIYLLCSDGLNDMVDDQEIRLTLSKYSANLVQAAEELVKFANKKGGKDNISVILVRIRDDFSSQTNVLQRFTNRFTK